MKESTNLTYVLPSSKISANLLAHILLTAFWGPFWIWPWVYKTTDYLNNIKRTAFRKPSSELALFILIPFYSIYWYRKTAQLVELMGMHAKITVSFAGICTFFSVFFPAIATILVQMEIDRMEDCVFTLPGKQKLHKARPYAESKSSASSEKAHTESSKSEATAEMRGENPILSCPNCNEELSFMGYGHGDEAQCPFCDARFVVKQYTSPH